jgi:hypothetical protein
METKVYQGKWGYYPCDQETFLKLKKLNKAFCKAQKQTAKWHRWNRKKICVGPEPQVSNVFCEIKESVEDYFPYGAFSRSSHSCWLKKENAVIVHNPKTWCGMLSKEEKYCYCPGRHGKYIIIDSFGIDRAYNLARNPCAKPEDVKEIEISLEDINGILEKLGD